MFNMVSCNQRVFETLRKYAKSDGGWSQENLSIFGVIVASTQPNMIGELGDHDFHWCRRFILWFS